MAGTRELTREDMEGRSLPYRPNKMPPELNRRQDDTPAEEHLRRKCRIDFERRELRREQAYEKAVKATITPLVSGALTSMTGKKSDPFDFGMGTLEYEVKSARQSLVGHVATALVFGYFSVIFIDNVAPGEIITRALQVCMALSAGAYSRHRGYIFATETQRGQIIRKTDYLQSFGAYMKAGGGAAAPGENKQEKESEEAV